MAILIVEHNGTLEGASLSGRVLIGRRASNHVVVSDPAVSRIHAWIDTTGRQFCLTDAGSRTGTFVNGQRVANKVALRHGDRINIGPASLIFRTDSSLPAGVSQLDFGKRATNAADGGILFDCTCGAPLWISTALAGRMGKCRFCGTVVQVPHREHVVATDDFVTKPTPPAPAASVIAAPAEACGACQSPIDATEQTTTCPSCGLTFHADCWAENYGCSAYGCAQVNALLPKTEIAEAAPTDDSLPQGPIATEAAHETKLPKEYALLGGSVVGLLLGAFTFGVPALVALIAVLMHLKRRRGRRGIPRVVFAAAALAVVGVVVGVFISYIWWLKDVTAANDVLDVRSERG